MNRTGFYCRLLPIPVRLCVGYLLLASAAEAADRVVLRNLKVVSDRTVARLDEDGVALDDGTLIAWDEIERGKVAEARQPEFDRLLQEVGEPLYRIRQRLSVGDYRGLLPHAEAVYTRYADRDSPTAYLVVQSLMWARLASGRREESLDPYLRSLEYLRRHAGTDVRLPGDRRLVYDSATGLSSELLPVWFDESAARSAVPRAFTAIGRMQKPRPEGVNVYFATLALCAGQAEQADRALGAMTGNSPVLNDLRELVAAQREVQSGRVAEAVQRLGPRWTKFDESVKPLALYWLGTARGRSTESGEQQQALLELLRIPAIYGQQQPDLAAASLFQSMGLLTQLKDLRGSIAVRKELLDRFAHTAFAARATASTDTDATPDSATPKEN